MIVQLVPFSHVAFGVSFSMVSRCTFTARTESRKLVRVKLIVLVVVGIQVKIRTWYKTGLPRTVQRTTQNRAKNYKGGRTYSIDGIVPY